MRIYSLLLLFSICFRSQITGQATFDTAAFDADFEKRAELVKIKDGIGLINSMQPYAEFLENGTGIRAAQYHQSLGTVHRWHKEWESAEMRFEKAKKILENKNDESALTTLSSIILNQGILFKDLEKWEEALANFEKVINLSENHEFIGDKDAASASNSSANIYRLQWKLDKSLEYFHRALKIYEQRENSEYPQAVVHYNLAATWQVLYDYKQAIREVKLAEKFALESIPETHRLFSQIYSTFSQLYYYNYSLEEAEFYLNKALEIEEKRTPKNQYALGEIMYFFGDISIAKSDFAKAESFYFKSIEFWEEIYEPHHPIFRHINHKLADLYLAKGDYERAILFEKRSLKLHEKKHGKKNSAVANAYGSLARLYSLNREYDKALATQKEAIARFPNNFSIATHVTGQKLRLSKFYAQADSIDKALTFLENYEQNKPEISDDSLFFLSHTVALEPSYVAYGWMAVAEKTGKIEHYNKAANSWKEFFRLNSALRNFMLDGKSEANFINKNANKYESALNVFFEVFTKNQDPEAVQTAFRIMEENHNLVLNREIQKSDFRQKAGVPDTLTLQEDLLISRIKNLEEADRGDIHKDSIFRLKKQLIEFRKNLNRSYPKLIESQLISSEKDLEELKNRSLSGATILEYFSGNNSIFILKIDSGKVDFLRINKNEDFEDSVFDFIEAAKNGNSKTFEQTGKKLSETLLNPCGELAEKVIFIPHGILGYLPFELLPFGEKSNRETFADFPYLIRSKTVSYFHSGALASLISKHKYPSRGLLAIAPEFPNNPTFADNSRRSGLNALHFNEKEAAAILRIAGGGKSFLGETGIISSFFDNAKKYDLIHLATHAIINNSDSENSFIAFYQHPYDSIGKNELTLRQIYELNLKANMLITSVCDGGIGKLQKGEGIISLARGFFKAGAKNVVTTLWSVNDKSTSEIMISFYENLKKRHGKRCGVAPG